MSEGTIFTFYSYKGGTGRTMALANVAWILASRGKRVLAIDWDVEAPGLHRYFAPFLSDPTLKESDGLLEFLELYVVSATKDLPSNDIDKKWYQPFADIKRYAEPVHWEFADSGGIDVVGAGRQIDSYGARVNNFDWQGFYSKFGGGAFLDESIRQMKEAYDYVLIDSRTGISDSSGICTIHLPDALIVFYTLNNQSIEGASSVAAHIIASRNDVNRSKLRIWAMATRVESAEKSKLKRRRRFAKTRFAPILIKSNTLLEDKIDRYLGEMEILYVPFYAYDEVLATIADTPGHPTSILSAMERLTARITDGQVASLAPSSELKRTESLHKYYSEENTLVEQDYIESIRAKGDWDIVISASSNDFKDAERLYYLLGTTYKVFYPPKTILPGERWANAVKDSINSSHAMLILISKSYNQSETTTTELRAAQKKYEQERSFRIIPVLLDPTVEPNDDFLKQFQYLTTRSSDAQDIAQLTGPHRLVRGEC
jgi:hypothetical protein